MVFREIKFPFLLLKKYLFFKTIQSIVSRITSMIMGTYLLFWKMIWLSL